MVNCSGSSSGISGNSRSNSGVKRDYDADTTTVFFKPFFTIVLANKIPKKNYCTSSA